MSTQSHSDFVEALASRGIDPNDYDHELLGHHGADVVLFANRHLKRDEFGYLRFADEVTPEVASTNAVHFFGVEKVRLKSFEGMTIAEIGEVALMLSYLADTPEPTMPESVC